MKTTSLKKNSFFVSSYNTLQIVNKKKKYLMKFVQTKKGIMFERILLALPIVAIW